MALLADGQHIGTHVVSLRLTAYNSACRKQLPPRGPRSTVLPRRQIPYRFWPPDRLRPRQVDRQAIAQQVAIRRGSQFQDAPALLESIRLLPPAAAAER